MFTLTFREQITKIVSGGQTGVDRAALDVAMAEAIRHGGWCPRGRLAEDGEIPHKYQLTEMQTVSYPARTKKNITASDATLIFYRDRMHGGTLLTYRHALEQKRPCLCVDLKKPFRGRTLVEWVIENNVIVLNVAGPRESMNPGIYVEARDSLLAAIRLFDEQVGLD